MDAFCLLFADTFRECNVGNLDYIRSFASIPFGGRYRLVDFILSSLVNSSVPNVGVVTRDKYNSLLDHLGAGKEWGLDRKYSGLKMLTPYATSLNGNFMRNKWEAMDANMDYIDHNLPYYAILADSNIIAHVDFEKMLEIHEKSNADLTVAYKKDFIQSSCTQIRLDEEGRVIDALRHREAMQTDEKVNLAMHISLMKKSFLKNLIKQAVTYGWEDMNKDVVARKFSELKIHAMEIEGYSSIIHTTEDFYRANMDLLREEVRKDLFNKENQILTKVKDTPPAIYGDGCVVRNCVIADGCQIYGEVYDSIIFRDVKIKPGAVIRDSILMQGTEISKGAHLRYVITDKNVTVTPDKQLSGEASFPFIIDKKAIV